MRLHYDVHEGKGEPVLLLHGFLSSRAQWLANLPGLKSFCSPVTVELWGHGRSPDPDNDALLAPLAYVDQFEKIRQELGISQWYLLGHSFGAGLTLRYALNCPGSTTDRHSAIRILHWKRLMAKMYPQEAKRYGTFCSPARHSPGCRYIRFTQNAYLKQ